jgi:peptidoglycan hydrolase-like protein with peptidoglycan-binding domain
MSNTTSLRPDVRPDNRPRVSDPAAAPKTPAAPATSSTCAPKTLEPNLDQRAEIQRKMGTETDRSVPQPSADASFDYSSLAQPEAKPASTWQQPFPTRTKYEIGPSFAEVKAQATLGKGQSGPGVEELQRQLNGALKGSGMNSLAVDGLFGPKTEANLKAYQESRGLPSTGVFDERTRQALENNTPARAGWQAPAEPAPSGGAGGAGGAEATGVVSTVTANMTEAQKFDHYKAMIERSGGRFNPNGPNIVGVRNSTNTNANGGGGRYDDTMAVIWMQNGQPRVREFRGNTEPAGSYRGRMGQDVDGNGTLDQGRLRTGHYQYQASTYRGGSALRMVGDSVVDRDTNGDGNFGNDRGASSRGGASMLFHRGGNNTTGSAGCQTMPPAEFDRFMSTLREAGLRGNVGYTLVDAQ